MMYDWGAERLWVLSSSARVWRVVRAGEARLVRSVLVPRSGGAHQQHLVACAGRFVRPATGTAGTGMLHDI